MGQTASVAFGFRAHDLGVVQCTSGQDPMNSLARATQYSEEPLPSALALVHAAADRHVVQRAAAGLAHVQFCARVEELTRQLDRWTPAALVATSYDADAAPVEPVIRSLRATSRGLPVVQATRMLLGAPLQLRAALRAVLSGERARLRRSAAANRCAAWAPPAARHATRYAVENGHRPMSVPELAAAVGKPRKTLDRHLSLSTQVSARRLLVWGRLLAVAIGLDDADVTVAEVTAALQFTSPTALRNLLQRHTGLTPTGLRLAGGSNEVLARFKRLLREG